MAGFTRRRRCTRVAVASFGSAEVRFQLAVAAAVQNERQVDEAREATESGTVVADPLWINDPWRASATRSGPIPTKSEMRRDAPAFRPVSVPPKACDLVEKRLDDLAHRIEALRCALR